MIIAISCAAAVAIAVSFVHTVFVIKYKNKDGRKYTQDPTPIQVAAAWCTGQRFDGAVTTAALEHELEVVEQQQRQARA